MDEPGAGARGLEDHRGAVLHPSGGCIRALAAMPEPGGRLFKDGEEVCGAPEARLFTREEGVDFAVGLVDPVEAVSSSLEERMPEAGEAKGSSSEERPMSMMEEEKDGSLPFTPQGSVQPGSLRTCLVANSGLPHNEKHALFSKACCFKDFGCIYGTLDKVTEGSPCERGDLVGNGCGVAEVKTCMPYIDMASEEINHCNVGSLDSMKPGSEQWRDGLDGLGRIMDTNNEPKQNDRVPNIEAGVLIADSVSGSTGVSVGGKAVQFLQKSDNPVTSHMADVSLWDNNCFSDPAGFMYDMLGMETEGNPREQNSLAGESVSGGGVDAKTRLDNLETCCKLPHDNYKDSPDLVKLGIERLPDGIAVACLKRNADPNLEKYGLLPKVVAKDSMIMHRDSVSGSSITVSLDCTPVHIGDLTEHKAMMENVAFDSQGGGTLSLESQFSRRELNTCEEDRGTGWADTVHDMGVMSDLGEHHTEELPSGIDGLTLITGANHEMERVLPNIDPVGSCTVHEGSVLSLDLNACNSAYGNDFVSNGNDTESQSQQLSPMLVFRRRNPKRIASSRDLCSEKPDQINKASSGSSRPKRVELAKSLDQITTHMFPNKITRERSDLNRPHKSSAWGNLERLTDDLSQIYGHLTPSSHPTSQENGRSSKRSDQINLPNIRKCRSSRSSKHRCSKLSDIGHLTNELKERSPFSAIADSDTSLESRREVIPKVAYTSEFTDSTNSHHLERDFASSTQEICAAEIHGECAKLSTSEPPLKNDNGTVMLPIEFSPDSVLEVASVTCESNASASHDVILHETPLVGVFNGDGHHSVVLPTSYLERNQGQSLMQLEQQAKTAGVSENMKMEQTDPTHTMMNNDAGVGDGDVQTLQKSKTARKNNVVRKKGNNKKEGTTGKKLKGRDSTQISSCEASKPMASSNDSILPDPSELLVRTGYPEFDSCFEVQTSALQYHGNAKGHLVPDNSKGSAFHTMKSPKHKRKDTNAGKKGKVRDSHTKGKGKKKNIADGTSLDPGSFNLHSTALATSHTKEHSTSVFCNVICSHTKGKGKKKNIADGTSLDPGSFNLHSTALAMSHTKEHSDLSPATELVFTNSGTTPTDLPGSILCKGDDTSVTVPAPPPPPRAAWVCCDDCQKWRCIPAELADVIGETNCRWSCKDNGDKAFADCSIPQEKSNAEINAELDLSDVSADEADACRAPSWTHVKLNLFLHRSRRTQSIDESMVCNCKSPEDGEMGCGDGCLNRMLNIECVKRTCPCGEQCSNQQFQRRNYAKLRWFHSGKKGFGLQLQEDVSEGRFLIEYVGEVLNIASHESRQQYYASKGQRHFYFMALNGGEVIDAYTKGNLGRFINHSCSPNCHTEKWMVNGEVCIGIFAMRNIKKGEELTFDYNYVRVSGAAPQKCFCGTAKCQGYIDGGISIVDAIKQYDTEAGHFEHTVVHKDSEESMGANGSGSHGSHPDPTESEFCTQDEDLHDFTDANAELEPLKQTGGTLLDTSEPENSLDVWCSQEDEDYVRTPVHVSQTIESSLQHFPVHGIQSSDCLRQTPCTTETVKDPDVVDGSPPGFGGNLMPGSNANKRNNLKHHRNVKQSPPIDNEHILGVEGSLNDLLDRDGGISKRKDATNGYLKLLFLTAAEGDNSGGTSKSVRDLSLILDALLKTKSRAVLLDIINKNGLQMLHNILKQNRNKFHRIPILRKLLKVLEYLALKEILTYEHINGGPRCAGVESFRDSMMNLTRHNDIQIQQIARNFCDQWIPRNIARSKTTEYPRASTSAQDFRGNRVWNSTRRKRKSRWDYQPDEHYKMAGLNFQKAYHEHGSFDVIGLMGNKMQGYQGANKYQNDVHGIVNSTESADDEVPPGFESHQERQPVQALDCKVAPGICMGRYQPSLTISYGIPIAIVQHIGTPEAEGQCHKKWKVAPGVPFNPFPPLPPYPRGNPCPSTSCHISQHGSSNMKHNSSGQGHYGRTTTDRDGRVHRTWRNGPRTRWPYGNHARRFPSSHQRSERFQRSRPQ